MAYAPWPNPNDPREVGRPIEVFWAGWRSDTYTLQRSGWQISANQDVLQSRLQLAIRHEASGLLGLTEVSDWEYRYDFHRPPATRVYLQAMGKPVYLNISPSPYAIDWAKHFQPIDATPQLTWNETRSLEDLFHFAPAACENELFVSQASVPDLLDRIITLQQPAREERAKARVAARILVPG